jgi:uncharacterized membrane protein (Fun14 family)
MSEPGAHDSQQHRSFGRWFVDQPRWKKLAMTGAVALMLIGGIFMLLGVGTASAAGGSGGPSSSFVDTGGGKQAPTSAEPTWSTGLFRLGFSFFAGFCIGYAARAFLKVTALASGVALLLLFGLSYFEFLTVNWDKMESSFDQVAKAISEETERFQTFITGSLPSIGMGAFGLFSGFKKS